MVDPLWGIPGFNVYVFCEKKAVKRNFNPEHRLSV